MSQAEAPLVRLAQAAPRRERAARLARLLHEGCRYLLASVAALVVDYGLLVLLTEAGHLHYLVSSTIGYCTGAVVHYVMSARWVFRSRPVADRRLEFAGFFAVGLLGLLATQAAMWCAVDGLGLGYKVGKVAAVAASFLLSFVARKALLFRSAG